MLGIKALFLILLSQTCLSYNEAALVVTAPTSHRAQLGEDTVLPCSFNVGNSSIDFIFLDIVWLFQGHEILRYNYKGSLSESRMSINKKEVPKGVANMEIRKITISDVGLYMCMVLHSGQKRSKDIDLRVYATPSVVIEKMEKEDQTSFVSCSVTGFYPKDISVHILKNRTITEDSVLSEYHTNADGTYSVTKTWNIPPDVPPQSLSCFVHHETLIPYVVKDLQLDYSDASKAKKDQLNACESILDKKLDKVIKLLEKLDTRIDELKHCSEQEKI